MQYEEPKKAGEMFTTKYKEQLEMVLDDLSTKAKEEKKTIQDLLPYKDGDTLASWERTEFTHYRNLLAPYLEKMGYEVVAN